MNSLRQSDLLVSHIEAVVKFRSSQSKWIFRKRNNYVLVYQFFGVYDHRKDNQVLTLSGDCLALFNKNDDYAVTRIQDGECIAIHFNCLQELQFESFVYPLTNTEPIKSLFVQIKKEWDSKSETYQLQCLSTLYRLLHFLLITHSTVFSMKRKINLIRVAENFIRTNYARNYLTVKMLADMCDISIEYFRILFKEAYQTSPNKYIANIRCNVAQELLSVGGYPVNEIATMTGFSDIFYFSKVFKAKTGQTPTEYRKSKHT